MPRCILLRCDVGACDEHAGTYCIVHTSSAALQGAFVWGLFGDGSRAVVGGGGGGGSGGGGGDEVGRSDAARPAAALSGAAAADTDASFDNDSLFLLLTIRRLNSMNSVVSTCTARLFYAVVSLVHIDAMRALLGPAGNEQQEEEQQQELQLEEKQDPRHLEATIITRLESVIRSLTFSFSPSAASSTPDCNFDPVADDDSLRFDAVRATTATSSLISLWSTSASSPVVFKGCSRRMFASTLLRVLERSLDGSCPHDLLLMVTGIYLKIGGVAVDDVLELFVDGSGAGGKNVVSVLEQLADRAKVKWSQLPRCSAGGAAAAAGAGVSDALFGMYGVQELDDDQRFVKACATLAQFCMELKAYACPLHMTSYLQTQFVSNAM